MIHKYMPIWEYVKPFFHFPQLFPKSPLPPLALGKPAACKLLEP